MSHERSSETSADRDARSRAPENGVTVAESSVAERSPATHDRRQDSINIAIQSFLWLSNAAAQKVGELGADLKEHDDPPWLERVIDGLLEVALAAGAAASGELLAGLVAKTAEGALKEFVRAMFDDGIKTGVAAGSTLLNGHHPNTLASFISSQQEAVRTAHMQNQTHFINVGQYQLHTAQEADALAALCSPATLERSARLQYEASRDAWVSYLAQAKFGANRSDSDGSTTNMSPQDHRDATNRVAPGFVPERAPELIDAAWGHVPGVLEIGARLPSIGASGSMAGEPKVEIALLNGVNKKVREQYEDKPLAEMRIPRQITAKVDGDLPNFTINLDELGGAPSIGHAQGAWLRARATVEHPENAHKDDFERQIAGLRLLLEELTPKSIEEKL